MVQLTTAATTGLRADEPTATRWSAGLGLLTDRQILLGSSSRCPRSSRSSQVRMAASCRPALLARRGVGRL